LQLGVLLAGFQRLEQTAQANANNLQQMRGDVQALGGEVQTLRAQIRDIPLPGPAAPQQLFEPPAAPPPKVGRGAVVAGVLATLAALGAVAVGGLVFRQQQQQQAALGQLAASMQTLHKAVERVGEQVASIPPPPPPPTTSAPASASASQGAEAAARTVIDAETGAAAKPRVLLPNLVGLRLADARAAVAPLQLQLLPTDKKLKEASKIGWQSPNPGAELEPEEAVTVALKPPGQKKKKK
jgi:hypothetical protein